MRAAAVIIACFSDWALRCFPQIMQVQGANGSGKTSLLGALCGFMMPGEGNIAWRGESIRDLDEDYCAEMLYLGRLNAINKDGL